MLSLDFEDDVLVLLTRDPSEPCLFIKRPDFFAEFAGRGASGRSSSIVSWFPPAAQKQLINIVKCCHDQVAKARDVFLRIYV